MRLRWTQPALADFIAAQEYIARDNPSAAQTVAQRIGDAAQSLPLQPHIGRPGHIQGTREKPVGKTPYVIVYRIRGDEIELLRLWHGRQDWKSG